MRIRFHVVSQLTIGSRPGRHDPGLDVSPWPPRVEKNRLLCLRFVQFAAVTAVCLTDDVAVGDASGLIDQYTSETT